MHPPRPPTDTTADRPLDLPPVAGEPHARAGVGGAPSARCPICQQTEGHNYGSHAAYFLGRARSAMSFVAEARTSAEARKLARDELAKIEADPVLGQRR